MKQEGKKPPVLQVVGFAWYANEAEYLKLLAVADDAGKLYQTYAAWREAAEKGFQEQSRRGAFTAVKTEIDVDELVTFCRTASRKIDGKAGADFVNHKLAERFRSNLK